MFGLNRFLFDGSMSAITNRLGELFDGLSEDEIAVAQGVRAFFDNAAWGGLLVAMNEFLGEFGDTVEICRAEFFGQGHADWNSHVVLQ